MKRRNATPATPPPPAKKRLVTFSVFGTVVDMRTITPELRALLTARGFTDWPDAETPTTTAEATDTD